MAVLSVIINNVYSEEQLGEVILMNTVWYLSLNFYYKIYFLQYVVSRSMLHIFLLDRGAKIEFCDSKFMFANS